jgi:hypothetical protein
MIDLCVEADYMVDDVEPGTIDRFLELYLLWLFGFVMFCKSAGDAVSKYLIPYARMIADAPLDAGPRSARVALFCRQPTWGCVRLCLRRVVDRGSSSVVPSFCTCDATSASTSVGRRPTCLSTTRQMTLTSQASPPWVLVGAFGR